MVKVWSWAAAALACAIIPTHGAVVPNNNLALEAETETRPFRFDIPDGDLSGLEYYTSLQKRQEALPLPSVLYRGSGSSPEEVKARGGFVPRQEGGPLTNETFGLESHHWGRSRTAYSSTTRSFGVALGYSVRDRDAGWIYKIHPTPNMIDMNGSGFRLHFRSEEEFSALGGIRYDQIEAWMPMSKSDLKEELTRAHVWEFHDFEKFSAKYPGKNWTVNPDYDHKYDSLTASPGQPQLAGDTANLAKYSNKTLEEYAIEFMQKNGAAVGWDGKFPLSSLKTPVEQTPPSMAELCAKGPDGKVKYGKDEDDCLNMYAQCLFEGLTDTRDATIKCMETMSLAPAH
ncbi:Heat-labile enterotoxin IIA, A chain [Beauveria bassiana]|nr:Heat-labile enterotoxin IIA, A chain [Beauveria bassiana]KAH8715785.1 Heat-labile enterotoxin IIA, A chain [Beauveria bassiana]